MELSVYFVELGFLYQLENVSLPLYFLDSDIHEK